MYIILDLSVRQSSNGVRMYFNFQWHLCIKIIPNHYRALPFGTASAPTAVSMTSAGTRRRPPESPACSWRRVVLATVSLRGRCLAKPSFA